MSRNIWIGKHYEASNPRVLLLGESDYGDTPPLIEYIPQWLDRKHRDHSFARISNTFGAGLLREKFWDQIAFYNFVPGMVGPTRLHRPTPRSYSEAQPILGEVLNDLKPDGVLILGIEQSQYSKPVIQLFGAAHSIAPHPAARGLSNERLAAAWVEFTQTLQRRG